MKYGYRSRAWGGTLIAAVLILTAHPATATGATATTFYANATGDGLAFALPSVCAVATNTTCTPRAAITYANANPGSTVQFAAATYLLNGANGQLNVVADMTLVGVPGGGGTVVEAATAAGTATTRVVVISGGNVTMRGLTIRNGVADADGGGGILNNAMLTLVNVTVSGNRGHTGAVGGTDTAGSPGSAGGIMNTGMLTLTNSTVSGNTGGVGGAGGGGSGSNIGGAGMSGGAGGVASTGTLTLVGSAVSGNAGGGGGSGGSGAVLSGGGAGADGSAGGIMNTGTLTLTNSTVSGNTGGVGGTGGGGGNGGPSGLGGAGGVMGPLTLMNSTVSSNTGGNGGGGGTAALSGSAGNTGGTGGLSGAVTAMNSTVSGNTGGAGGGGGGAGAGAPGAGGAGGVGGATGTLALTNVTVSGNMGGGGGAGGNGFFNGANGGAGGVGGATGTLALTNVTVSGNMGGNGGAGGGATGARGAVGAGGIGGSPSLTSTLITKNLGGDGASNNCASGAPVTASFSLAYPLVDRSCGAGVPTTDIGPLTQTTLTDNGGPTLTLAIAHPGPAFAVGDRTTCQGESVTGVDGQMYFVDQRGAPRVVGNACSIGAFEPGSVATVVTFTPPASFDYGAVALSATVSGVLGGTPPGGGNAAFVQSGNVLNATLAGGTFTASANTLAVGSYTVFALYGGSILYAASQSANQTVRIVPHVVALAPASGDVRGGTTLTITGAGFVSGQTSVSVGGNPVMPDSVTPTRITVQTPAHAMGMADVAITVNGQTTTLPGAYQYGVVNATPQAQATHAPMGMPVVSAPTHPAGVPVGASTPTPMPQPTRR